jgi:hypothetical protein
VARRGVKEVMVLFDDKKWWFNMGKYGLMVV